MGRKLVRGPADILIETRPAGSLVRKRSAVVSRLLKRSGQVGNAEVIARTSTRKGLTALLVLSPAALLASALYSPFFMLAEFVPLLIILSPEIGLRDRVAQRKEGVERELPFFSMFASVLGGAGVSLYSALGAMSEGDVFPSIRREALIVRRDVDVFGMNPSDAMERLASTHPSGKFSRFLLGYTSKVRSGGDVSAYLAGEGNNLLRGLEGEWTRYVARVGIIGSMMITVFGVVPLLLMVVGVFSPSFSVAGLIVFTGVGVPLFSVGLLHMAGRMQPVREEKVTGKPIPALGLSLAGVGLGLFTGEAWSGAAAALFIFFLVYGLSVREQLAERKAVDEGAAMFLKDLLEFKRQEYDLTKAVIAIQGGNRYNHRFDKLLSKVATQLKAGVPLDTVRFDTGSRLGRLVFLLLGEMSRSGGGSVDTVYQASSFVERMAEMRRNASAEMKPYLILAHASPVLLAFGVTFVGGVLSSFGRRAAQGLGGLHLAGLQSAGSAIGLSQVSDLLIIASAASLGLIGAKITDLTAKNTLRASVNVGLAGAAVALMTGIGSPSLMALFPH
jgi:flagellar protein FlaJ